MAFSVHDLGNAPGVLHCARCSRPFLPAVRPGRRMQQSDLRASRVAIRAQAEPSQEAPRPAKGAGEGQLTRRSAALALAALAGALPAGRAWADASAPAAPSAGQTAVAQPSPGEFKTLADSILAYSFTYPVAAADTPLSMVVSRRPERYSSAAPLSPDARQRIVSELVDFRHGVVIAMTVGPPSGVLKGRTPGEWKPREVAETVLIDRSTARVTEGQRIALQQVENVTSRQADGTTYWAYEHLSQGSPNLANPNKETFRHAIAVTAWRPGLDGTPYLYTLNLSCADEDWGAYGPALLRAADSFRLTQPGKGYVPPDKDPWRFF